MKKNCANCLWLNHYEGNVMEGEGPNGYYCDKLEDAHKKMNGPEGEAYLKSGKRCFEPKETGSLINEV